MTASVSNIDRKQLSELNRPAASRGPTSLARSSVAISVSPRRSAMAATAAPGAMPRPGCPPVSFLPGQAGSSHPLSPTGWHGCRFPLVRRHRTRNGAGKTTTMRLILGLDSPSAGSVTTNGKPFAQQYSAMREVGALLDAKAVHGGRTACNHLWCLAAANGLPRSRVDEVIGIVGLQDAARKRSKGFSLGMSQHLGIAAALLGDPEILMFDEPVNGLDPEDIRWIRLLMRSLAAEGRTVFVSSHLMSEMARCSNPIRRRMGGSNQG